MYPRINHHRPFLIGNSNRVILYIDLSIQIPVGEAVVEYILVAVAADSTLVEEEGLADSNLVEVVDLAGSNLDSLFKTQCARSREL